MKKIVTVLLLGLGCGVQAASDYPPAPNGLELPKGYENWRFIASSHREDNHSLRVILGNNIAIEAIKSGNMKPWPKGTVLAKLVWKDKQHPKWEKATIPGEFLHSEIMVKDAEKYARTGGWGYARWLGKAQKPYGKDASFAKECYMCHITAKEDDFVFTRPAIRP